MAQLTTADLRDAPSIYHSPRDVGDVLIGEDVARPVIEASSSGNDTALQGLLSQTQWIKIILEKPHTIYYQSPSDELEVMARPILNVERALTEAAANGQATTVTILLAFTKQQGINTSEVITRSVITKSVNNGHAAVVKALGLADPSVVEFPIGHGKLPLYEAAKRGHTDMVAVLLELGADPLHPGDYNSPIMALAAKTEGSRMTEVLLKHNVPIDDSGALHNAASFGYLDTMQLLIQHGAEVNEVRHGWTPMHYAASKGQVDAIKLLDKSGARSDLKNEDGKTPSQLLEERNTA